LIEFLLEKYDRLLINDQRWIVAKCNIQSDEFYYRLFTGAVLKPQMYQPYEGDLHFRLKEEKEKLGKIMLMRDYDMCECCERNPCKRRHSCKYQELEERSVQKPDIEVIMASTQKNGKKNSRRRNRRRGAPKGSATGMSKQQIYAAMGVAMQPKRGRGGRNRKRRPRGGNGGTRKGGGGASGLGKTSFSNQRIRTITVTNEEFVAAVTVANQPNFNVVSYAINPGNATLFPWLALQAKQWEKYVFSKLVFFYKREVSEFATNGQAGKVILNVDFDASDAPPGTKQQMEDTVPHADGMACENIFLPVPQKEMHGATTLAKYVRIGGLPGGSDIKTYDVGNFNIATQGCTSNAEIGELRVAYSVTFSVPVLENQVGAPANNQVSWFQSTTAQTYTTAVATTAVNATASANGLAIVNTAGSMVPPAGNYLVDYSGSFADSSAEAFKIANDFQKNGVTVFTFVPTFATAVSLGTPNNVEFGASAFVSANGTDAFTQRVTFTGAAGTLSGATYVRWTAI
jgi:hypothetical protein